MGDRQVPNAIKQIRLERCEGCICPHEEGGEQHGDAEGGGGEGEGGRRMGGGGRRDYLWTDIWREKREEDEEEKACHFGWATHSASLSRRPGLRLLLCPPAALL